MSEKEPNVASRYLTWATGKVELPYTKMRKTIGIAGLVGIQLNLRCLLDIQVEMSSGTPTKLE